MKQKLFGNSFAWRYGDYYHMISGWNYSDYYNDITYADVVVPCAGTFRKLRAGLGSATGGGSATITLMVNDTASALTCTITDPATSGSDETHDVSVNAGDVVCICTGKTGSPTSDPKLRWNIEFEGSDSTYSILMGCLGDGSGLSATDSTFVPHGYSLVRTGTLDTRLVVPCAGTFRNLYVKQATAPGSSTSWNYQLNKNEATSSALVATVSDSATTGNNTSDTLSVVAGDYITILATKTNSPATTKIRWGFVFVPSTARQYIIPFGSHGSGMRNDVNSYQALCMSNTGVNTDETVFQSLGHSDCLIVGCQVLLYYAPEAGKSVTVKLRENENDASVPFTVTIEDANKTGSASGSFTPADNSRLNSINVPSNTPATSRFYVSYIGKDPTVTEKVGPIPPFFRLVG
jgi:hypothetical protein